MCRQIDLPSVPQEPTTKPEREMERQATVPEGGKWVSWGGPRNVEFGQRLKDLSLRQQVRSLGVWGGDLYPD